MLNFVIFITGFCSMIYELGLAQLLTNLLGSTVVRYSSTLAIYVVTMGLGSFFFRSRSSSENLTQLIRVELAMTLLGFFAAPIFIFSNSFFGHLFSAEISGWLLICLTHIYIGLCGFVCGYEIPILASLVNDGNRSNSEAWVLSWDYIGMFAASVLFPFFMIPFLGIFSTLWITSLLNLLCVMILFRKQNKKSAQLFGGLIILFVVNGLVLFKASALGDFFSEIYLQGF